MIGTYIINETKHYHPNHTTVTEKRAPTDDSIRLLREMEAKVQEKFVNSLPLKDNIIEGRIVRRCDMFETFEVLFKINGKVVQASTTKAYSPSETIESVCDALGKAIGKELLKSLPNNMIEELMK